MKKMSYKQFLNYVREQCVYEMPEPDLYKVSISQVTKNNNVKLDGLCIRKEGEHISPTVYLNNYYEDYVNGRPMKAILPDIVKIFRQNESGLDVEDLHPEDFEKIKDHIIFRLVNYEKNKEQLEDCPFMPFCDLALTFRWLVKSDAKGMASSLITNKEMACWNVTTEDLFALAVENTKKHLPSKIQPLEDILMKYCGDSMQAEDSDMEISSEIPLYILSNSQQINGATCMIYEGVLEDFAKKVTSDFYILPSSVHEVLLLPVAQDFNEFDLLKLVHDANSTVVCDTDFLSDNIYRYDRDENRVVMIDHTLSA